MHKKRLLIIGLAIIGLVVGLCVGYGVGDIHKLGIDGIYPSEPYIISSEINPQRGVSSTFVALLNSPMIKPKTLTKVNFDKVVFDNNGEWDSQNARWVCKDTGIYWAEVNLAMTMGVTEKNLQSRISLNGVENQIAIGFGHQNAEACAWARASCLVMMHSGEYLEVFCWHTVEKPMQLATTAMPLSHNVFYVWRIN